MFKRGVALYQNIRLLVNNCQETGQNFNILWNKGSWTIELYTYPKGGTDCTEFEGEYLDDLLSEVLTNFI